MFADLGNCDNCGRDLRFVASHPNDGLCHPCWRLAMEVPDIHDPAWPGYGKTLDEVIVAPPNARNVTPRLLP